MTESLCRVTNGIALLRGSVVLQEVPLVNNPESPRASQEEGSISVYFNSPPTVMQLYHMHFAILGSDEDFQSLDRANISLADRAVSLCTPNATQWPRCVWVKFWQALEDWLSFTLSRGL